MKRQGSMPERLFWTYLTAVLLVCWLAYVLTPLIPERTFA